MGSRLRDTVRFLFELFCEVSPGDQVREPYIIRKYPESYKNEEELKNVPKFTFPCKLENTFIQHYSFVLTSVDSKYTFCFCRYDPKTNTALVLLSHLPWHDIFYKLLNCIATLENGPERGELTAFLAACRIRPPAPGHTLRVTYDAGRGAFTCRCPGSGLPSIPDNCNLTEYFSALEAGRMAALWAALLHERRVAVVASKPARLAACVQAANDTLFPMSWQHIFIPILPPHLVDYLLAPMPFLIGVPRSVMETVRMSEVGDVVVLDADSNELKSPFRDLESLPAEVVGALRRSLADRQALGDAVSRAFLRALVALIGGYRDAIRIEKGQLITFNPEAFVKTRKNMQPFLRKILQSQIFQQFIDERLELLNSGRGFSDEFELECTRQAERAGLAGAGAGGGGGVNTLKQQYREWARGVKREGGAFFKTVKDKANPAVQSAVKTVRQGGKNMKSAVKGLKNKMPKTGSRPSSINTTDDSRYSCGSGTPVSSDSSSTSRSPSPPPSPAPSPLVPLTVVPRAPPPPVPLPLDLLTEMELLFPERRSPPKDTDKAKTLNPPRLPQRPHPPLRYPIVSTRKLIDLSDAPAPPPRAIPVSNFTTNITKHEVPTEFHTSAIRFTEDNDKAKLKLTLSAHARSLPAPAPPPVPAPVPAPSRTEHRPRPSKSRTQESCGTDLIQLDDSPTGLDHFDPLKYRDKEDKQTIKSSADSALLHEYGLDFGQFGLSELSAPQASTHEGWTTFN
ncbi:DENN domain-containing protein 1A isoform X1 [Danaus plexippus]|uniref:DENN domain-containing protein 1A isoform X1 n=1 Tax=Danaus plexippus TaxID=13037 RepID=UPI000239EFDD|nr:DENN domain-containing protein 1A isoform X1 [Danaus plexippus]